MVFAHDTDVALLAAVAWVNTAAAPDTLVDVDDLTRLFVEHDYTGRHDGDAAELDAVRRLRAELRKLLLATRDEAVPILNAMLDRAQAVPRLVRHDRFDWHVHASSPQAPLSTRIAVETAMAMIDVVRADETSRIGVCADETCQGVVVDLSRNRSRRYCSTTCGNRAAVAAYRARQAART